MLTTVKEATQINLQTKKFLENLEMFPWFEHVGQKIRPNEVKQVFSWSEAWEHLQDESWINAPVHDTVDSWHEMWDISYDKALQVARRSVYDHEFESGITSADAAAYDVAAAAVEIATRKQSAFFTALMKWYARGHFPCGWEGEYPNGQLVVF